MASLATLTNHADIAYFFEFGDKHQGESQHFMRWVASHPEAARRLYGLRSHTVLNSIDSRLFEAADIMAWEWAKHVARDKVKLPRMRGSLRALLGDIPSTLETNLRTVDRRLWHLTPEQLQRYFDRAAEFELFSDQPSNEALQKMRVAVEQGL